MIRLCVIFIVTFIPLPSNQHFIWPIDMCVLADICNHTWIPECGLERDEDYYRLFLDECDMYEYNCDNKLYFEIRDYAECFGIANCPPMKCPPTKTCPPKLLRHGHNHDGWLHRRALDVPKLPTTIPNLPYHMLHGKRRYTPNRDKTPLRIEPFPRNILQILRNQIENLTAIGKPTGQTKKNTKYIPNPTLRRAMIGKVVKTTTRARPKSTAIRSVSRVLTSTSRFITQLTRSLWATKIIKTSYLMSNGKRMVKIFKGINLEYRKTTKEMKTLEDSDFLE